MEASRQDWRDGEDYGDYEGNFTEFHHTVAEASLDALRMLAIEPATLNAMGATWSEPEVTFVQSLYDINALAPLMIPPEDTPLDNRQQARELLDDLHDALPLAASERRWLVDTSVGWASGELDDDNLSLGATKTTRLMVDGLYRPVSGRGLLERLWMWRRETGIYAGGEGLSQAKVALAGLVNLLRPTLEEPTELAKLSGQERTVLAQLCALAATALPGLKTLSEAIRKGLRDGIRQSLSE